MVIDHTIRPIEPGTGKRSHDSTQVRCDSVLQDQYAEVLLRFRRRSATLSESIEELVRLGRRELVMNDAKLQSLLSQIDHAHREGTLKTHGAGRWCGAPTGRAIAERFGVGKVQLRFVRDAYYTLHLGLAPFDADDWMD